MEKKDAGQKLVACPAYHVCAHYGTARRTCRYDPEALPPVGMAHQSPEAAWCQPGIATMLLLLSGERRPTR